MDYKLYITYLFAYSRFKQKMSEDEDTTILLNSANRTSEPPTIKPPLKEYEYIPPKKLRKPIPRHTENLTPLTTENQSVLVSFVAAVAGISFGYDMGLGRQIAPLVKNEFGLSCSEENMIVNVWFAGCLLGAVFGGKFVFILIEIYF